MINYCRKALPSNCVGINKHSKGTVTTAVHFKMAYKDVRDLSEHLKQLDYPNHFSISSIYTPYGSAASFHIVADILQWLAGRLEPDSVLPGGTDTEGDRVLLIRSAAEFFVTKAGIKLNPRRLYASSASTATELLKVTALLLTAPTNTDGNDEATIHASTIDLGDKIDDLRRARELSSELTNIGASLFDLLAKEAVNKETRAVQASRPLELANVEKYMKTAIHSMTQKLQLSKNQLDASVTEKNAITAKLDRKTSELERVKQRLEALQKIRPAFQEEFERLEGELKTLFDQYFVRVRCLDSLRVQVASRVKLPTQVQMPIAKPTENSMTFLPDGLIDSDEELIDGDNDDLKIRGDKREQRDDVINVGDVVAEPRAATRLRVRTAVTRGDRFVGNMMGGSDMESSMGSEDSDSDLDLADDLQSDDDETIVKLTGEGSSNKVKSKPIDHSDEDF